MKKRAFGISELLFVIVIFIMIYLVCFRTPAGRNRNPFEEQTKVRTQQEAVNQKIKEIENTKAIKDRIEQNLNRESY